MNSHVVVDWLGGATMSLRSLSGPIARYPALRILGNPTPFFGQTLISEEMKGIRGTGLPFAQWPLGDLVDTMRSLRDLPPPG